MSCYASQLTRTQPLDEFCYVSVCAIADSPELAESMAINLAMSHSFLVENVLLVALKSAAPHDDNTELDELLHQKALQRQPPCALKAECSNGNLLEPEIRSLGVPSVDNVKN